jgi:hypothetical protein
MIKNDFRNGPRYNICSFAVIMLIIGLIMGLAGCTPITTIRQDGSEVRHYFGYVRVIEPLAAGPDEQFKVLEVETLGFRIEKGLGFGYFHERNEYIPLDCRLVIRVTSKQQLEEVLETLSPIMKEGLCVTVLP